MSFALNDVVIGTESCNAELHKFIVKSDVSVHWRQKLFVKQLLPYLGSFVHLRGICDRGATAEDVAANLTERLEDFPGLLVQVQQTASKGKNSATKKMLTEKTFSFVFPVRDGRARAVRMAFDLVKLD